MGTEWISQAGAARLVGIPGKILKEARQAGEVKFKKRDRFIYYRREDVLRWAEQRKRRDIRNRKKGLRNPSKKKILLLNPQVHVPISEAAEILNLVRYASAHNQIPLTDDELRFIAKYPNQVKQILTITP